MRALMVESNPSVDLLLRLAQASWGPGELQEDDLEQLRSALDQAEISTDTYLLLPLLSGLGTRLGRDDPLAGKLRGIKRLTWYRNQLALRLYGRLAEQFKGAGIPTLLLGDVASSLMLYNEHCVRPIQELSLLVHSGQLAAAFELLQESGWTARNELTPVNLEFLAGQRFIHKAGNLDLQLRWHVLPVCLFPNSDDGFWAGARPVHWEGRQILLLDPADFMLYLAIQCFYSKQSVSSLWIADALRLIQTVEATIEWSWLLDNARRRRLVLPVKKLLNCLAGNSAVKPPADIMRQLEEIPVSRAEQLEHRYNKKPLDARLLGNLPLLWFDYRRFRNFQEKPGDLPDFATYLARYWQVVGRGEMLAMLFRLAGRRLKAICRTSYQRLTAG